MNGNSTRLLRERAQTKVACSLVPRKSIFQHSIDLENMSAHLRAITLTASTQYHRLYLNLLSQFTLHRYSPAKECVGPYPAYYTMQLGEGLHLLQGMNAFPSALSVLLGLMEAIHQEYSHALNLNRVS